jgi:hypothetical protein
MLEQRGHHVAEHGIPVAAGSIEFYARFAMSHVTLTPLPPRSSSGGSKPFELHSQGKAHFGQHFLDFVQGFSTEILGLEHFGLGLLTSW